MVDNDIAIVFDRQRHCGFAVGGGSGANGMVAGPQTCRLAISPSREMRRHGCDFPPFLGYALYADSFAALSGTIADDRGTSKFCISLKLNSAGCEHVSPSSAMSQYGGFSLMRRCGAASIVRFVHRIS